MSAGKRAKRRGVPRWVTLGLAGLLVTAIIAVAVLVTTLRSPEPLGTTLDLEDKGVPLRTVTVYFLEPDSLVLVPMDREVLSRGSRKTGVGELVAYLTQAPEGLVAPLPHGTRLRHFFEEEGGTVVLDFSVEIEFLGGESVTADRLRLTALVRTLAQNLGGVKRLRLLVHGRPLLLWGRHLRLDPVMDVESLL